MSIREPAKKEFRTHIGTHGGADQSARDSTNINTIVAQYHATGIPPAVRQGQGVFGDFSQAPDFHAAYNLVHAAQAAFEELPSRVREAALNNPVQLMEMLDDPNGLVLLRDAGLDIFNVEGEQLPEPFPKPEDPAQDPPPAEPDPAPE
ncbi:internal scaffolding protein [Microviridae sp.]|nr:internal scaffolding protein [Microviridae sp.]